MEILLFKKIPILKFCGESRKNLFSRGKNKFPGLTRTYFLGNIPDNKFLPRNVPSLRRSMLHAIPAGYIDFPNLELTLLSGNAF